MSTKDDFESESILARLKRETAEIHQRTEDKMPFAENDFSLSDYQRLIVNFYNFYSGFEPQIERALERYEINLDYSQRLKTLNLAIDLQNLKISLPSNVNFDANESSFFDSKEKIFGALYVIEGSTLGGQVISKILKQKFALDASNGAAFFVGYGSQTGAMWNSFRTAITEFADKSDAHSEIIAAAVETFQQIGKAVSNR